MELVGVTSNKHAVVVILNKHFCFFSLSLDASNYFFFQCVCHVDVKFTEKQAEVTLAPRHAQCYILKDTVETMILQQHLCFIALIRGVEESSMIVRLPVKNPVKEQNTYNHRRPGVWNNAGNVCSDMTPQRNLGKKKKKSQKPHEK